MTYNEEMQIPYVSKELCEYLRKSYDVQNLLRESPQVKSAEMKLGIMIGINTIIERLEAIQIQQEENNGIHC